MFREIRDSKSENVALNVSTFLCLPEPLLQYPCAHDQVLLAGLTPHSLLKDDLIVRDNRLPVQCPVLAVGAFIVLSSRSPSKCRYPPSAYLNNTQRGAKTYGFQNGKFRIHSKLAILVHQQLWYTFGWFFDTQKGIKTDGFQYGKF